MSPDPRAAPPARGSHPLTTRPRRSFCAASSRPELVALPRSPPLPRASLDPAATLGAALGRHRCSPSLPDARPRYPDLAAPSHPAAPTPRSTPLGPPTRRIRAAAPSSAPGPRPEPPMPGSRRQRPDPTPPLQIRLSPLCSPSSSARLPEPRLAPPLLRPSAPDCHDASSSSAPGYRATSTSRHPNAVVVPSGRRHRLGLPTSPPPPGCPALPLFLASTAATPASGRLRRPCLKLLPQTSDSLS